jgi:hypothetical protein
MDINIPSDVKTYINNNPTKFKNLPITLRNIEKFMESYKSPSSLDIEKRDANLMLNLRIKGYVSNFERDDIVRQISFINSEVPFSVNNKHFDRNL